MWNHTFLSQRCLALILQLCRVVCGSVAMQKMYWCVISCFTATSCLCHEYSSFSPIMPLILNAHAGAKKGRLESLSGGSKQSQSTSSKLRLTADSSNQPSCSGAHLQHGDSDADSHPRLATSQFGPDSSKRSASLERQRTSDLSSRDVLDTMEEGKVKDEMQSEDVAAVRCGILHTWQVTC